MCARDKAEWSDQLSTVRLERKTITCYNGRVADTITIRIDDEVRATLEAEAKRRGIALGTYLRGLASERARAIWRGKARKESERIVRHVASSKSARRFIEAWGTPPAEIDET